MPASRIAAVGRPPMPEGAGRGPPQQQQAQTWQEMRLAILHQPAETCAGAVCQHEMLRCRTHATSCLQH